MKSLPLRALASFSALFSLVSVSVGQVLPYYLSWGRLYDDTVPNQSQVPTALAQDARGNVYVTGWRTVGSGKGIYVAKYDVLDGRLLWERKIDPTGTNEFIPNDIAVNGAGDCAITGSQNISGSGIDFYTLKLNGSNGTNAWPAAVTYNGPNSGEDTALKVAFTGQGHVIVTGRSVGLSGGNSTGFDFATIKYDGTNGSQLAIDRHSQMTGNLDDVPAALAVDAANNVYVAGTVKVALSESRFYLRKLRASDLALLFDITPIDTGAGGSDAEGGATGVAVDSAGAVVATGMARDNNNRFGYFTIKFNSTGTEQWRSLFGPFSQDTFGSPRPRPVGVAIGGDDAPIVTGTLRAANGDYVIRTVKYTSAGFMGGASDFWPNASVDTGAGFGDTFAKALTADGAGNAIVVGETRNQNGNSDFYVAKYDTLTGERVYGITFNGSTTSSADKGVAVAVDRYGNISALGNLIANKGGSPNAGFSEFGTFKLNRFIAPTGGPLPDGITGVADNATVKSASPPAISDSGVLATRMAFKVGTKATNALLVEGDAAGGVQIPAVKGQPAPVAPGEPAAKWVAFSDPVVSPNGRYAFAGKVTGPETKANGVWTNLSGTLQLALRQGSQVPGTTDNLVSVTNLALENDSLVALLKLSGAASANVALVRLNAANTGTVLLRKGQSGLMINGEDHTVKGITVFTPPEGQAGDGRWQGSAGVVVRVSTVQTSNPAVKASAIVAVSNAGVAAVRFATGGTSPITGATYASFGLPSTATGTTGFSVKAGLTGPAAATNAALFFTLNGSMFNAYAQKGVPTGVTGLPAAVTYADFGDPIVNTNNSVAYFATLKGSAADVPTGTNKAIIFGSASGMLTKVARTGEFAPDTAGEPTNLKWTAFTALALPGGTNAGPVFIGKLGTPKNNLGLWVRDSQGGVRRLLRAGDKLGDQTVKKFTLLTAASRAASAPRSFDAAGSVAVAITFTDGTSAIVRFGIP